MSKLPTTEQLELERDGGWLTIWLSRPEVRNALSTQMVEELFATLDAVREDRSLRGIAFRGRGGVFCAGADLKEFRASFQGGEADPETVAAANRRIGELLDRVNTMPQVVVMLVEGAAMAGGLGLVCAADAVAVTRDARFALTETTLGIPPAQIAPFVAARVGLPQARYLMVTAARFDGIDAMRMGLANHVVASGEELSQAAEAIKRSVGRCAPGAVAATKEILFAAGHMDRESLIRFAGEEFAICMLGEEGREGIASFAEKRKPRWAE